MLRNRRLDSLKFRRQHPIEHDIVDVCLEKSIVVELDGDYHDMIVEQDLERQRYLKSLGYEVLRFWNQDVLSNCDAVAQAIRHAAAARPPHPNPLPQKAGEQPDEHCKSNAPAVRGRGDSDNGDPGRVGGAT